MLIAPLWLAEFLLEFFGSVFAFRYRRENPLLLALLTFGWVSDVICFRLYGHPAYAWASWADYTGHYVLLAFLGCQICGKLLNERRYCRYALALCGIAGGLAFIFWSDGPTLKDRLWDSAIGADSMLIFLLVLARIAQRKPLNAHWTLVGAAIIVRVGGDLFCSMAATRWASASHWLPVGEISALLMWNWAVKTQLREFRVPLERRFEEIQKGIGAE